MKRINNCTKFNDKSLYTRVHIFPSGQILKNEGYLSRCTHVTVPIFCEWISLASCFSRNFICLIVSFFIVEIKLNYFQLTSYTYSRNLIHWITYLVNCQITPSFLIELFTLFFELSLSEKIFGFFSNISLLFGTWLK